MGERITIMIAMTAIVIMIPYIMTIAINGKQVESGSEIQKVDSGRDVLMQIDGANVLIDVEQYIAGVLPGMVDFSSENSFIEAQAVAIRTKIYYAMGSETVVNASELDYKYYSIQDYINKWGKNNYKQIKDKYDLAVINTVRKIIE